MKIVCISDTHSKHEELTKDLSGGGDILIHAGDVSTMGRADQIKSFLDWFSDLNFKYKIFIAGNHDFGFQQVVGSGFPPTYVGIAPEYTEKGVIYLMDNEVTVEGLRIYGSPWQPRFYDWAFNVDRGEASAKKWEKIPEGLDILITHGPPYSILDNTISGEKVGCEELYKRVVTVKPRYHVFGHIHYGYGTMFMENTTYINAASLGERYEYDNKPFTFHTPNK